MTWLFGVQSQSRNDFPLATRDMFYVFCNTSGPEAEVSSSQDLFQAEVPRSVLHHTKEEKISSCKSVYFLKFMLP